MVIIGSDYFLFVLSCFDCVGVCFCFYDNQDIIPIQSHRCLMPVWKQTEGGRSKGGLTNKDIHTVSNSSDMHEIGLW